jgi:hypothetical protein
MAARAAIILLALSLALGAQACADELPAQPESGTAAQRDEQSAVIIDRPGEPVPRMETGRMLTEEEVQELVWNLPEVQRVIVRILDQGGIPISMVGLRPNPGTRPGADKALYTVHFHGDRIKEPIPGMVFVIDAFTGEIGVYEKSSGGIITLDDWRQQQKQR